jgi:hypothetical protein
MATSTTVTRPIRRCRRLGVVPQPPNGGGGRGGPVLGSLDPGFSQNEVGDGGRPCGGGRRRRGVALVDEMRGDSRRELRLVEGQLKHLRTGRERERGTLSPARRGEGENRGRRSPGARYRTTFGGGGIAPGSSRLRRSREREGERNREVRYAGRPRGAATACVRRMWAGGTGTRREQRRGGPVGEGWRVGRPEGLGPSWQWKGALAGPT